MNYGTSPYGGRRAVPARGELMKAKNLDAQIKAITSKIKRPEDLLPPDVREKMDRDLAEMARSRRRALSAAGQIYLP